MLEHIAEEMPQWREHPEGVHPFNERLRAFNNAMTGVLKLSVLNTEGQVVAASHAKLLGENFAHRDYFRRHADWRPGSSSR